MQKAKFWLPLPQYFTAVGRVSRLQYLLHSLILFVAFIAFSRIANLAGQSLIEGRGHLIAATATTLITSYVYFCLDAKRVHDLKWPAAIVAIMIAEPVIFSLMNLVFSYAEFHPPAGIGGMLILSRFWRYGAGIIGLILLFIPGNKGQNKYGPDPLQPPAPPIDVF